MKLTTWTYSSLYLGGIFAWLVSVPLFGPLWLALAPVSRSGGATPISLFLGAHALGLVACGLAADTWRGWRDAGLRWAPATCAALTAVVARWPAAAGVAFPLMGVAAAWGITAWAPVFRALAPVRRRARAFAWVPMTANGVKYGLSFGIGHVSASALVLLATAPLIAAAVCGRRLARIPSPVEPGGPIAPLPPTALRALWILAPFLLVIYLAAGLTYAAMTPMLLGVLHTHVDLALLSYVASVPPLAILADRTSLGTLALFGPLVSGAAFVVFAITPTTTGAVMTQTLMGVGYAALDLVTWLALLEIASPGNAASLFGIGLNTNVLPILISAGMQSAVPAMTNLGPATLAAGLTFLMLVAVVAIRGSSVLQRVLDDAPPPDPTGAAARSSPSVVPHLHGKEAAARVDTAAAETVTLAVRALRPGTLDDPSLKWAASTPRVPGTALLAGTMPSSIDLAQRLAHLALPPLTPRELQVALLAITGRTVSEIAGELLVSENTVKTHLASIYRKTQTRGRADLTARVIGLGAGQPGG